MARRMTKGLVALSSAAVLAIYGVGYSATAPAAASMAAGMVPGVAVSPAAGSSATAATASPGVRATTTTPTSGSARAAHPVGWIDGTYSGTGWSRRGSVSVAVTIRGGRIASAPITGVTTHYDQSVIDPLPGEVLAAQDSHIDLVSGATDSSLAYQQAVAQALAKAGAGGTNAAGALNASAPGSTSVPPPTADGAASGAAPGAEADNGFSPRGHRGGAGFDRQPLGGGRGDSGDRGNAG
ncbi:MAG: FMN-binding protein [Chloroflexota bacterium]